MISRKQLLSTNGKSDGFTLIEVLVALVVASVSLIAALGAAARLSDGANDLKLRALALWSAENRLATIRVENERGWVPIGKRSFDCSQGNVALRCDEDVLATPNPFFRRVEIQVWQSQVQGPSLAKLTGFATQLPGSNSAPPPQDPPAAAPPLAPSSSPPPATPAPTSRL